MIPGTLGDALTKLYPDDMVIPDSPTPPSDAAEWQQMASWFAQAADILGYAYDVRDNAELYVGRERIEAAKQMLWLSYAARNPQAVAELKKAGGR